MRIRMIAILAGAVLCLAPTASWADLAPYSQDFEGLAPTDGDPNVFTPSDLALSDDGWLIFGNVFCPNYLCYIGGYGPYGAPNGGFGGFAFSLVGTGEGGPQQGAQQLVVLNDYNNLQAHFAGNLVEANVFQQQTIGAGDVGETWLFEFDAKRGDIQSPTTAAAFIKILDPFVYIPLDMTDIPQTWGSYSISVYIAPEFAGRALQFGFLNTTTNFAPSGVVYDNVNFRIQPNYVSVDIKPGSCPNPLNVMSGGDLPVAILGTGDLDVHTIDPASVRLAGVAPLRSDYEDVGTPFDPFIGKDDCGYDCHEMEGDGWTDLTFKFDRQEILAALGAFGNGDCLVLTLTGNFWPEFGGGPIEGEDVLRILDHAQGAPPSSANPALDTFTPPGGISAFDPASDQPIAPTKPVRRPLFRRTIDETRQ